VTTVDKLLYTVAEVMSMTGLGKWKVYDLIRDGTLRSVKIGACRRVPADALREFIAALPPEVAA
jgi:excisionase family DNA binding protein